MRSKLFAAGIVAGGALLLATPLGVQAAGLVTSGDIVNDTIRSKDIKNGAVKGHDVKDDSLKGADVDESALAKVPDADKVDGVDSQALVQKATVRTEQATCAGTTFFPDTSASSYSTAQSLRYSTNNALVRCNVELPVNAVVRSASFTVVDSDANPANDMTCELWRTDLGTGVESKMATITSSGEPGQTVLTDSTVSSATVEANYAYFAQCDLATTPAIGLYGSSVVYDVNAAGSALPGRAGPEATVGSSTR